MLSSNLSSIVLRTLLTPKPIFPKLNNKLHNHLFSNSNGFSLSSKPRGFYLVLKSLGDSESSCKTCLLYAIQFTKLIKWKLTKETHSESLLDKLIHSLGRKESGALAEVRVTAAKILGKVKCKSFLRHKTH